ncbi:helix-turn-helix domain-containing protein (plasmid) [Methylomonas sp. MS20]|uniref:helix-turn-helix domain-containing protein n=1 Tax=Methylomonas sp. MS20 TaxID=3418769 RepID=UPI003D082E3D
MSEYNPNQKAGHAVARLRAEAGVTQSTLAEKSGLDQSRISRIEKGEVVSSADIDRVLDALEELGVTNANNFKKYAERKWTQIEPPSFWNPERECLEITEDTLEEISNFLDAEERPWPLRRQIEKHRESLSRAANYLVRLNHNIAFIGDQGVGKSTGISFIFDLLVPPSATDKAINRPVLETGAGGTTFCEVHIKTGPEFGISLLPMNDAELRELVADFCASKWAINTNGLRDKGGETISVSREAERAIRNMSGLVRKKEIVDGKPIYNDPVNELVKSSDSEEEFRTQVLGLMRLEDRTRRELWYDSSTRKHPMEWVTETFKAVNNGRLSDVSLPMSIDLLIPSFSRNFGELEITVIDTKGVDDVAVREDLDHRLKDPRTKVVFCSRFNDAPGTSTRVLLQHMQKTFSERFDTGKVSILALPRAEEARSMKDDMGEHALTDSEGYEFKRMQVTSELSADDLAGIPLIFYNFESDDVNTVQAELFGQISYMRKSVEARLIDLCDATQDIIKNHEKQALNAALEEVANRLNTFLKGNRRLGARERLAHVEAINTARDVRYASTLWAATRRNGEYSGLNILHLVGVGAARDASLRSQRWFIGLDAFLKSLKADGDLALAGRSIDQIATSASESKRVFQEAVIRGGIEVYRDPLSQAPVWSTCASEWGRGPKFKLRVADHLEQWFTEKTELKEILENMINSLWEKSVIAPLLQLAQENSTED